MGFCNWNDRKMGRRALRSCNNYLRRCFKRTLTHLQVALTLLLIFLLHLLTWLIQKVQVVQVSAIAQRWILGRQRILLTLMPPSTTFVLGSVSTSSYVYFILSFMAFMMIMGMKFQRELIVMLWDFNPKSFAKKISLVKEFGGRTSLMYLPCLINCYLTRFISNDNKI